MLIYEKDNKLNINFENNVEETPDLQISKESGKTEVKIDGQQGGSGANVLTLYTTWDESIGEFIAFKDSSRTQTFETYEEALNAGMSADIIKVMVDREGECFPHIALNVVFGRGDAGRYVGVTLMTSDGGAIEACLYFDYGGGDDGGGK